MQNNHCHNKFIKRILKMPLKDRSDLEQEKISRELIDCQFFSQRRKEFKKEDLVALINMMKFESFNPIEDVITHGDIGNKFYIIIKGVVSVHVPNPAIKDRALQ
jgi:signal-transduction protein with cAMP-binding, CBS, and nucleotidyltransferase domain